jgi:AcrR family transcriptional regulator
MSSDTGIRSRMKAERPGQILEAAFDEFVEKGFAAARVEDIARKVGVTKGTVYVYFKDKEALFAAVMDHATQPQLEALATIGILTIGTYRERLEHFIRTFYTVVTSDERSKKIFRLLFLEGRRDCGMADQFHEASLKPFDEMMMRLLEEGVKAGEFRTTGGPDGPDLLLSPAISAMICSLLFSPARQPDIERYIKAHFDLLFNGLLAR